MRNFLFFFLICSSAWADLIPEINRGEVKITYPCDLVNQIPKDKLEIETITFFETEGHDIYKSGYVLRRRVSPKEVDFTVKYRSKAPFTVNDELYQTLTDSSEGELKCEFDFTYQPDSYQVGRACAFKSETFSPVTSHFSFVEMMNRPLGGEFDILSLKEIEVEALSWKVKLGTQDERNNPFGKRPSLELWRTRGECRMEISGKFEAPTSDFKVIDELARRGFSFLQKLVPARPSEMQGNKTAWALGESERAL